MSEALVRHSGNSVLVRLAEHYQMDPVAFERTVRQTLMPSGKENVSNEQLAAFLLVADQYGLNPFAKEIYAFDNKKGGIGVIVPIDGWYRLANAHPNYDGIEFLDHFDEKTGQLESITARVYRKDRSRPIEATEYMMECKQDTGPWRKWPRRMLRHKAAIQAFRAAFSFSGMYDPDEADRIQDVEATVREPERPKRGVAAVAAALEAPAEPAEPEDPQEDRTEDGVGALDEVEPPPLETLEQHPEDGPSFFDDLPGEEEADNPLEPTREDYQRAAATVWSSQDEYNGRTIGGIALDDAGLRYMAEWVTDGRKTRHAPDVASALRLYLRHPSVQARLAMGS